MSFPVVVDYLLRMQTSIDDVASATKAVAEATNAEGSRRQRLADNLLILHVSRILSVGLVGLDADSADYHEIVRRCYLLAQRHVDLDPAQSNTPPY
jgi:hypothetical protein